MLNSSPSHGEVEGGPKFSIMKKILFSLLAAFVVLAADAQIRLFHTGDETGKPYRIPAITTAKNGDVIALSDWRPCGNDIGYGRVDIFQRVSRDNGNTWGEVEKVLVGKDTGPEAGYGDACLVADRKRNELLLFCVSGDINYQRATVEHPQRLVSVRAKYNKKTKTWEWSNDIKDHTTEFLHDLFGKRIGGMFMGSGRICQSSKVKVGKYHRLYASMCTHKGNFVVYSDDFGDSWKVLGSATESCVPKGDEPKCEELPDGSVLISSRKHGGRYFNIFHFTDLKKAEGAWDEPVDSREVEGGISNQGTPTNGEIMLVPAKSAEGKSTLLALQSVPAGPGRSHVTIYYKELASPADYATPEAFAKNWGGAFEVTKEGSAYSTMTLQKDGRIGFYYEEEPQWYQMIYSPLTIEEITGGKFSVRL